MTEAIPEPLPEFQMSPGDTEIMEAQISEARKTGNLSVGYGNFYLYAPHQLYRRLVEENDKISTHHRSRRNTAISR